MFAFRRLKTIYQVFICPHSECVNLKKKTHRCGFDFYIFVNIKITQNGAEHLCCLVYRSWEGGSNQQSG